MPLPKPKKELKIAIILPCYKRPDYSKRCIQSLEESQDYKNCVFTLVDDGSNDGTDVILKYAKLPSRVIINKLNQGLRGVIIDFFEYVKQENFDFIMKMDNDCLVPKNWVNDILDVFENSDADILSPNVYPSNAAFKHGKFVEGLSYMPSNLVGGLWCMKAILVKDMFFSKHEVSGLTGAIPVLRQIINEQEPIVGWVPNVLVQDIGHWSGNHPEHIKSKEHEEYSMEVGRSIAWGNANIYPSGKKLEEEHDDF